MRSVTCNHAQPCNVLCQVIDLLSVRKGSMLDMGTPTPEGMQTIQYEV